MPFAGAQAQGVQLALADPVSAAKRVPFDVRITITNGYTTSTNTGIFSHLNFNAADIDVTNGSASNLRKSTPVAGNETCLATVTPARAGDFQIEVNIPADSFAVRPPSGGSTLGNLAALPLRVPASVPGVRLALADPVPATKRDPFDVRITITNGYRASTSGLGGVTFTAADIDVTNGDVSNLRKSPTLVAGNEIWLATVTPSREGNFEIVVNIYESRFLALPPSGASSLLSPLDNLASNTLRVQANVPASVPADGAGVTVSPTRLVIGSNANPSGRTGTYTLVLDTQPTGGKYDGVLGVLGALEIVRSLNDLDIRTRHPIIVTNWTNEEGTRFAPAMLGSGVFAGVHAQDWAYERTDAEGRKFGDELERIGWKGDEPVGKREMRAFFELHIEQGPILEAEGKDIGVVTHGQGLSWTQVTILGRAAHTGSTPMPMRRNAGLGMARVLERVEEIALSHAPHAVGAAGHVEVHPNSRNVIPGKAVFTVDFRSPDLAVIRDMEDRLHKEVLEICNAMGLEAEFEKAGGFEPVEFDRGCVEAVRRAAERLGYSHRDIVSGAGHDACWINRVAPAAMVMCPCVDGLSHNEAEDITREWAVAGADVLMHAVVETAQVVR